MYEGELLNSGFGLFNEEFETVWRCMLECFDLMARRAFRHTEEMSELILVYWRSLPLAEADKNDLVPKSLALQWEIANGKVLSLMCLD
jgi:hypothetical protein